MSLTSYRAAPPRDDIDRVIIKFAIFGMINRKREIGFFLGLAVTYSPTS